ncbi:hypothetical protein [Opitutus sp. ER46]|uniref:hypothetical protein n=1 Tax=Opitutus sp. ER46 TaxID=2161864 RepID=UPI0011B212A5|nr:hypothetical protein [Opitutus sp. ER46]
MAIVNQTLEDIVGPWKEPCRDSSLIDRVRHAWTKPTGSLTNHELATCLRQSIAVEHLIPIARERLSHGIDDGSEIDDDELARAVAEADYRRIREAEHKRILAARFNTERGPADPKSGS